MEATLGLFTFSSKFECGNLARAEQVDSPATSDANSGRKNTKSSSNVSESLLANYEFNLWTRPDCSGTQFENNNRTWFYFGIRGGAVGDRVRLNVVNLNKQSKLYSQGMQPVTRCEGSLGPHRWERVKEKCTYKSEESNTIISWVHLVTESTGMTFYAFTYPFTYTECQTMLQSLDQRHSGDSNSVYYHRELLVTSLDGWRVDLVTVTSTLGRLSQLEERLPGLFPETDTIRPPKFKGKKFVFVSARVHPGETPSSHVLNGFLNFITSDDPRAQRLRDLFVFKVVPMLNPDGVVRGHYRTDQRGVNLNRVYVNPSPIHHPTIHAVRQVLLYHHHGEATPLPLPRQSYQSPTSDRKFCAIVSKPSPVSLDEDACHSFTDVVLGRAGGTGSGRTRRVSFMDSDEPSASGWDVSSNISLDVATLSTNVDNFSPRKTELYDDCSCFSEGETGVTSMFGSLSTMADFSRVLKDGKGDSEAWLAPPSFVKSNLASEKLTAESVAKDSIETKQDLPLEERCEASSNLFLYVDLHGHASKRGIFIYGNWFEDPTVMVENMLFPKLLSMNCANFDFIGCNFSEKNMSLKDRREGLSKEGSGRVAIMRSTGLLRSYTLECNYNTGRSCNVIPPSPCDIRKSCGGNSTLVVPPKFTPVVYEDCGRQMAVSLLDLADGSHAWSRLPQSPHGNLNGVRSWLHHFLTTSSLSPRPSFISPSFSSAKGTFHTLPRFPVDPHGVGPKSLPVGPSRKAVQGSSTKVREKGRTRRHSCPTVDAENQEPQPENRRRSVGNKAGSLTPKRSKVIKMKPTSAKKLNVVRSLSFVELGEGSGLCGQQNVSDESAPTKHSLMTSITISPTLNVTLSIKPELVNTKTGKVRRQRSSPGKVFNANSKKMKTSQGSSSSTCDIFSNLGTPPDLYSTVPLSPRSPLSSLTEAQMSHSPPALASSSDCTQPKSPAMMAKKISKTAPSASKRPVKLSLKLSKSSDRLPLTSAAKVERIKPYPTKKSKKKEIQRTSVDDVGSESQPTLNWIIAEPPMVLVAELQQSTSKVKRRKNCVRKSL